MNAESMALARLYETEPASMAIADGEAEAWERDADPAVAARVAYHLEKQARRILSGAAAAGMPNLAWIAERADWMDLARHALGLAVIRRDARSRIAAARAALPEGMRPTVAPTLYAKAVDSAPDILTVSVQSVDADGNACCAICAVPITPEPAGRDRHFRNAVFASPDTTFVDMVIAMCRSCEPHMEPLMQEGRTA